jgi:pyrimidine deaminase RibD-like protein
MIITEQDKEFMRQAIRLANESVERGGGPFGAVIVKDGEIVAGSSNSVTIDNDPTAHAEVNTIREACRKLRTFDLSGLDTSVRQRRGPISWSQSKYVEDCNGTEAVYGIASSVFNQQGTPP